MTDEPTFQDDSYHDAYYTADVAEQARQLCERLNIAYQLDKIREQIKKIKATLERLEKND